MFHGFNDIQEAIRTMTHDESAIDLRVRWGHLTNSVQIGGDRASNEGSHLIESSVHSLK